MNTSCECDNTHEAVGTVCQYHWGLGFRTWKELWDDASPMERIYGRDWENTVYIPDWEDKDE